VTLAADETAGAERLPIMDRVSLLISRVAMFLVAVIVAIIGYEVVMRYFFQRPTTWVNDLSLWLGGLSYLFAGLYAMQQRAHIRVTALYDVVPRNVQRIFDVLATLVVVAFALGTAIGGFPSAWRSFSTWERYGTVWNPPIPATVKPLIIVVALLVAIQALSNLFIDLRKSAPERPSYRAD
jgi:TRAP-type C4-dicarboxylate transport system permease small subunit